MEPADFAAILAPIGKLYHMPVPRLSEYADQLYYGLKDTDPEILKKAVTKLLKTASHYVPKPEQFRSAIAEVTRIEHPPQLAKRATPSACTHCGDSHFVDVYLSNGKDVTLMVQPCLCTKLPFMATHNGWEVITEHQFWEHLGPHQLATWLKAHSLETAYKSGGISQSTASNIITTATNHKPAEDPFAGFTPFTDEEAQ